MEYGFVGQLYKLMRAGDTVSFRQALCDYPTSALNLPADGYVAPVLISTVFAERADYLGRQEGRTAIAIAGKKQAMDILTLLRDRDG